MRTMNAVINQIVMVTGLCCTRVVLCGFPELYSETKMSNKYARNTVQQATTIDYDIHNQTMRHELKHGLNVAR